MVAPLLLFSSLSRTGQRSGKSERVEGWTLKSLYPEEFTDTIAQTASLLEYRHYPSFTAEQGIYETSCRLSEVCFTATILNVMFIVGLSSTAAKR